MVDPKAWVLPLLAFAGLLAINVVVSLLLYWHDRTPLNRLLASFWGLAALGVVWQGAINEPPGTIAGFALPGFGITFCLGDFLRRALSLRWRPRVYVAMQATAALATSALWIARLPFWIVTLPVALGVCVPLVDVTLQTLTRSAKLSMSARLMMVSVVLYMVHTLDYPFLRTEARFMPYAFAMAIVVLFSQSICAPLMVLETTAAEVRRLQAEALQRERFSALGEASAVVAHEVRNPLGTMSNTIELLRKEATLSADGRELLEIQAAEVLRLDRLVRDLLSFSRPLEPKLGEVEIAGLVRHAVRSLRANADAARVTLSVEETAEVYVRGDADAIHIALVNVLVNAIQASPDGGTVRIALSNGGGAVRVTVDDDGDGVPPHAIDQLFKPFFTTRATGSGLGLAILDRIMKAHGGEVRVSNRQERGARFELVFAR